MFEWFGRWIEDIRRLPSEIKQVNEDTNGVSKLNTLAFFALLVISGISFYLEYVSVSLIFLMLAFMSLFWNSEISIMLIKMSKYLLGATLVGLAISGLSTFLFGADFNQVAVASICFLFLFSCWLFGID